MDKISLGILKFRKILIAPDKFKGTLKATQICDSLTRMIKKFEEEIEVENVPLSDGGDGFVECIAENLEGAEVKEIEATDPMGRRVLAEVCVHSESSTAYFEVANVSGLQLVKEDEIDPFTANSYGLGELIKSVNDDYYFLHSGASDSEKTDIPKNKIVIGAGGSAFNELGIGALSALGLKFYNQEGDLLSPNLTHLKNAAKCEWDEEQKHILDQLSITFACDVNNPLLGLKGSTYIFGPQKGVKEHQLEEVDQLLGKLLGIMKEASPLDNTGLESLPGGGASGGIVAGFKCFFKDCTTLSGIDMISELTQFDTKLKSSDLLITGEGMFDNQTLDGKVLSRLLSQANEEKTPVIVVCGKSDINKDSLASISDYECISKSTGEPLPESIKILDCSEEFGQEASMANPSECIEKIFEAQLESIFD